MADFLDEIAACTPALRRYARALTHDREAADDLVQDCLERAIRKRRLWLPVGPVRAWLFRILVNLHRNELRHRRRTPSTVSIEDLANELAVPSSQLDHLALAGVAQAMERLPDDQKAALLLVAVEGFAYADAARILDIPVGTLMSRLGRAREALRQITREDGPRLRAVR